MNALTPASSLPDDLTPAQIYDLLVELGQHGADSPGQREILRTGWLCHAALPYCDDELVAAIRKLELDGPSGQNLANARRHAKRGLRVHLGMVPS